MQVKIGEKIKDLRKVTGRKQEDLATALGVTPQAVSRWEANGGYPDMEMIPSIANYFHITIDELFGYNNDRCICGCSSMVESQPSKLVVWVRFPSPAPARDAPICACSSGG